MRLCTHVDISCKTKWARHRKPYPLPISFQKYGLLIAYPNSMKYFGGRELVRHHLVHEARYCKGFSSTVQKTPMKYFKTLRWMLQCSGWNRINQDVKMISWLRCGINVSPSDLGYLLRVIWGRLPASCSRIQITSIASRFFVFLAYARPTKI